MCNKYQPGERHHIKDHFGAEVRRLLNADPEMVHPREAGWVVRLEGGEMVLEQMTWGFPVALKAKHGQSFKAKLVNNARFDKLDTFWRSWAADPLQRCLIPTARFAEASGTPGCMTETWLSLKGQPLFAWAGLWRQSAESGDCYTGVTTNGALDFTKIHDRSPVILDQKDWRTWLTAPLAELYWFDRPYPAERIEVESITKSWAER